MSGKEWFNRLGAGLLAGLAAGLLMTLVILLLRFLFGVATPSELVGDRIAPLLGVNKFLELLGRFGGYNHLKQLGVSSVIAGQIIVGMIGGLSLALLSARTATTPNDSANSRRAVASLDYSPLADARHTLQRAATRSSRLHDSHCFALLLYRLRCDVVVLFWSADKVPALRPGPRAKGKARAAGQRSWRNGCARLWLAAASAL